MVGIGPVRSSGSTVAHTQSGCCSIRRPNRIGFTAFDVWSFMRRVGWYSAAGTISDCTAGSVSRFLSERKSPWNARPLTVVASPLTE